MNELTIEEFDALSTDTYVLYDIRSTDEINHGAIKGAIASSAEELEENPPEEKGKKIIICCSRGRVSRDVADMCRGEQHRTGITHSPSTINYQLSTKSWKHSSNWSPATFTPK